MELSNKKKKFIRRNAGIMAADRMARELRVPVREVEKILREIQVGAGAVRAEEFDRLSAGVLFFMTAAFLLLAPLAVIPGIYDFANLPQSAFIQVGVLFLAALLCARKALLSETRIFLPPLALPLFGFIAWSGISIFWALNAYEGFTSWIHWAGCALVFLVVANVAAGPREARRILLVLYVSGLGTCLIGILQHLLPAAVDFIPQVIGPSSTFANKNVAVDHVVLTLPLGVGFFLQEKRPGRAWAFAVSLTLMAVFLIYTLTRAGWLSSFVSAFVALFLLVLVYKRDGRWTWGRQKTLAVAACLLLFLLMVNLTAKGPSWQMGKVFGRATLAASQLGKYLSSSGEKPPPAPVATAAKPESVPTPKVSGPPDASVELRLDIFRNTWEMIKEHFLVGVGLGSHKILYPLYVRRAVVEKIFSEESQLTNVHNDFLQAFAETGVVGVVFLAWLGIALARMILSMLAERGREDRILIVAAVAGLAGLLTDSQVSFPFQRSVPPMAVAALLAALGRMYTPPDRRSLAFPKPLAGVLALGFSVFFVVAAVTYNHWIRSDYHYLRVTSAEKGEMWDMVLREADLAYHHNPHRQKIQSYVGRARIEKGQYDLGIAALNKVLAAYPNHMNALLNQGVAFGSSGRYEEALKVYDKVLAIKPDYAKVHNNRGNVFIKQGRFAEALAAFETAARLDPDNGIVHFNKGIAAMRVEDWPKAEEGFREALEIARKKPGEIPEGPDALYYNLGVAQMAEKKFKEAAGSFKKALEIRPDWAEAHRNLAGALMKVEGQTPEAVRHIQEAARLKPALFQMPKPPAPAVAPGAPGAAAKPAPPAVTPAP